MKTILTLIALLTFFCMYVEINKNEVCKDVLHIKSGKEEMREVCG